MHFDIINTFCLSFMYDIVLFVLSNIVHLVASITDDDFHTSFNKKDIN